MRGPGRPRRLTAPPATSIRISVENLEAIYQLKIRRKDTLNDILTRLIIEHEEHSFLVDAFEKQSKKIEEYVQRIRELESKLVTIPQ